MCYGICLQMVVLFHDKFAFLLGTCIQTISKSFCVHPNNKFQYNNVPLILCMFHWREAWVCHHNLRCVKVSKHKIICDMLQAVLREVGGNSKSTAVTLNSCKIVALPQILFSFSKLRSLDLTNNFIRFLPKEIGKLSSLEILYLGKNEHF
jgi:hypothetical protein